MSTYQYEDFGDHDTPLSPEQEKEMEEMIDEMLEKASFIKSRWGSLYSRDDVKKRSWGHRGPTIEHQDGTYNWFYNIQGYYVKD